MRYSFESRCRAVTAMLAGLSPGVAAQAVGASRATGYRWWRRYGTAGGVGLQERPSTPTHQPRRLDAAAEGEILAARTRSGAGPVTLGVLLARRQAQHPRWGDPQPPRWLAARARGRRRPLRLAYAEVRPSDRQADALAFLDRALAWFRAQGIVVQAVMTDNGPAYHSHAWRQHCAAHDLRHLRTRPYSPRTNGKAERFIQILLRRWAYAFAYPSSAHRTRALIGWLRWYNRRRPHGSLDGLPPVSRVSHLVCFRALD